MPVSHLDQWLADAAAEVLETMFFTSLAESEGPAALTAAPYVCARLSFHGPPSGRLGVRAPLETGRRIAANFLGVEEQELTDGQIDDVICELSNMVCGAVLSRLESKQIFELRHPEIGPRETGCARGVEAACHTLTLEDGVLEVWLELE